MHNVHAAAQALKAFVMIMIDLTSFLCMIRT